MNNMDKIIIDSYETDIAIIKRDLIIINRGIGLLIAMNISIMLKLFFN